MPRFPVPQPESRRLLRAFAVLLALSAVLATAFPADAVVPGPAGPGAIVDDPGCYTSNLGRNDDNSSGANALGFTINWFGTNRTSAVVNNNGGIALDGASFSSFSGVYIPTYNRPIIVATFADLDTRNTSTSPVTWGPLRNTFEGRTGYCFMWANVGFYSNSAPGVSAQILLLNRGDRRAGDFDIVMNYNWVNTSKALEVGFTSGVSGSNWYRFAGSGTAGAFNDSSTTGLIRFNSVPAEYSAASRSKLGRYVFQSLNGSVATASGPGTPGAPTNVSATAGASQATVSWTAPTSIGASAITDYIIEFSANGGTSWSTFSDAVSAATSTTVTGLTNGTAYVFRVAAKNTQGTGAASSASSAVTPATVPGAPSSLVATPQDASASIAFTAGAANGSAISNFQYQLNGGAWTALSPADATSPVTIPSLVNGTTYQVKLRGVNGIGAGAESPAVSVTPRTTPAAPTGLTGAGGNGSITVTFTPGSDGGSAVTNYKYQLNGGTWTALNPADATSPVLISGLVNGSTYAVKLRAVNVAGDGAESGSISVVAQGTPTAPANVAATPGNTTVNLTWSAADGNGSSITDYVVQYSVNGTSWITFADGTSTATSATVTGLTNGTAYQFRVAGVNAQGTGPFGTSSSTTPRTVPDQPTAVTPSSTASASAPVSWSAPTWNGGSTITDYVIEYAPGPAFSSWTTFADGTSTATSTTVTGLVNGTAYRFRVSAVNVAGSSATATSTGTATPRTTPSAPLSVVATPGDAQLVVTWAAPASDGGAAIDRYTATATAGGASRTCTWTTGAFTCTITSLTNGTDYTVTVVARNAAGDGTASGGLEATPRTVPSAVGTIGLAPGNAQVVLTWAEPATGGNPISDYRVQFSSNGGIGWSTFDDGLTGVTGATVSGLDNGVGYVFRVAAANAAGDGAYSTASASSTPRTAPNAPTAVNATPGNAEATVRWTTPTVDGGVPLSSVTVTASPGGATCTASAPATSCTITGLTNGTTYTFAAKARNEGNLDSLSSATAGATPRTVPEQVGTITPTPQSQSIALAWTAPGNGGAAIGDYVITYRVASSQGEWTTFGDLVSDAMTATVTGLQNGTAYAFRVAAVNEAGEGAASTAIASTPRTTPDAPTAVTPTVGDGQVALTWTPPVWNGGAAITDYEIQWSSGAGWTTVADGVSDAASATVTGLTNGTAYVFRVRGENAAGAGVHSATSAAATPFQAPGLPRNVEVTAGNGTVELTWAPPSSTGGSAITDYAIRYTVGSGSPTTVSDGTSTTTTATVTGLQNGTAYRFEVAAVNARGAGSYTTPADVTPRTVPDAPPAPTIASFGDGSVTLNWSAPGTGGSDITDYVVERAEKANGVCGTYTTFAEGVLPSTATTITGLQNGTAYCVRVRAVNVAGTGEPSPALDDVVPYTTPAAPTVTAATPGDGSVAIDLTPGSTNGNAVSNYAYSTDNGATWRALAPLDAISPITFATLSSDGTTALVNGTTYSVRVRAINAAGQGAASNAVGVTPRGTPAAPTDLTAVAGEESVRVTWTAPAANGAPITSYQVNGFVGESKVVDLATSQTSAIIDATAGSAITFTVQALNAAGPGQTATSAPVTPYARPAAATAVTPGTVGDGSVSLTWTAGAANGATITDYVVEYQRDGEPSWVTFEDGVSANPGATVRGLINGEPYRFRVTAVNAAGAGPVSEASSLATPYTAAEAPSVALVAASQTETSADFTITAPASNGGSPITGYEYSANGGSWTAASPNQSLQFTASGLTGGRAYAIRVRAVNAAGGGRASAPTSATTLPGAARVTAIVAGNQAIAIDVAAATSDRVAITDWQYEYATNVNGPWSSVSDTVTTESTTTVTGLTNGTAYVARVRARNATGWGDWSAASSAATPVEVSVRVPRDSATVPMGSWSVVREILGSSVRLVDFPGTSPGGIVQAVVTTTNADAYLKLGTTAGLDAPTGYASADWTSGTATLISFEGTLVNVNAALRSLSVKPVATTGTDDVAVNVHGVIGDQAYYPVAGGAGLQSGRFYEIVSPGAAIDARDARCKAKWGSASAYSAGESTADKCTNATSRRTLYGLDGYLATSTTQGENDFLSAITDWEADNDPGRYWIGGSDVASEGTWKWLDGPEAGQTFWAAPCVTGLQGSCGGGFAWWLAGDPVSEPNNGGSSGDEDHLEFAFNGDRTWNDAPANDASVKRYIVEYGGETGDAGIQQAVASFDVRALERPTNTVLPGFAPTAPSPRSQVTASAGTWTSASSLEYQWQMAAEEEGRFVDVAGATAQTFTPTSTDVGRWLRLRVTGTAETAETRAYSVAHRIVAAAPTAPTGVVADPNGTSMTVAWTPPDDDGGAAITSYTVTGTPGGTCTATAPATSCTVNGLAVATAYAFTVTATNNAGASTASSPSASATTSVAAPTGLTATRGNRSLQVEWAAPADGASTITDYRIRYSIGGSNWVTWQHAPTTATSATIPGLANGTTYTVEVAAVNAAGVGATTTTTGTPATVPAAPSLQSTTDANGGGVLRIAEPTTAAETGGTAITNYAYSLDGGSTWTAVSPDTTGTPSASGNGLDVAVPGASNPAFANGSVHTVLLRAVNGVGAGPASAPTTVRPRTVPGSPVRVSATPGVASATVSWSVPVSDGGAEISNYTVTSSPDAKTCSPSAGAVSCTVTGLTNGTPYTFTVTAANVAGTGDPSDASAAVTPRTVPGAPESLAKSAQPGSVELTWAPPTATGGAAVTDYVIEYRESPSGTWATFDEPVGSAGATTVIGLVDGTAYDFRVAAVNAAGIGAQTTPITATPGSRPSAPAIAAATSGDGAITVSWGALTTAQSGGTAVTGYQYTLDNGTTWIAIPSSASLTQQTIDPLVNGTAYSVRVRAVNETGEGAASAPATATPLGRAAAPTGLTVTSLDGAVEIAFTAGDLGGNALANYEYSTDDGTTWRALSPVDAVSPITISTQSSDGATALVNGTTYQAKLRAVTDAPSALTPATASAAAAAKPVGPPAAPATVGATAGAASALVTWGAPVNDGGSTITDYLLEYSLNEGRNWTTVADGVDTDRSHTVSGLVNGTATLFRVAAVSAAGTGPWLTSSPTTPRTNPTAPIDVQAVPGNAAATVSWSAPTFDGGVPIGGYAVTAFDGTSTSSGTCAPSNPATGTSCTVSGLANGTAYTFTVTATNTANLTSAASDASSPVTPRTAAGTPRDLVVTPGDRVLGLAWLAPISNGGLPIVRYEYSTNGGIDWTAIANSATAVEYAVGGLANGTPYAVQLRAVTSFGVGAATASVNGTPRTVPDAPTIGTPTPADGGASVIWTAPIWDGGNAITDYEVETSSNNGASWSPVSATAEEGVRLTRAGATATTVSVLGLDNGTPYVFRTVARNAAGTGAPSAASATVVPRAVPGAPSITDAVPGSEQVALTWDAPTSDGGNAITAYRLAYRVQGTSDWTVLGETPGTDPHMTLASATATVATVHGLQNGTAYQFQVEAGNEAGFGAASTASAAATPRTSPSAPTGLAAVPGDREVVLSFTPGQTGGAAITNYEYSVDEGDSFVAFAPATTGDAADGGKRSLTIGNLENGTEYTFRLRAVNVAGAGAATTDVAGTPRRVPDAPTQVNGSPLAGGAEITFTPGADGGNAVANYAYTIDGGQSWTPLDPADATSPITIPGLTNGTSYEIGLRAINAAGAGAPSTETAIVRPRTTPSAPTGITTESLDAAIRVYFTPGATGGAPIENYEHAYQTSTDDENWSAWSEWTALSPADDLSPIRINGLVNGTTYRFRVRAVNEAGAGEASSEQDAIDAAVSPEATPAALTVVSVAGADRSAVVRFQDDFVTGQMPSRLQYSVDGGASWREFSPATLGTVVAGVTPEQREVTIGGLGNGETYQVMLRGANNAGNGADSNAVAVTPVAPPAPPVEVTPVPDSERIQLTVVPGDNGGDPIIDVEYSVDDGATYQGTGSTREDFEVTGLENGVTYLVRTRLVNGVGPGEPSEAIAVTPRTVPDPPTDVEATQLDRSAIVEWAVPVWDGGAVITGYTVTAEPGGEQCAWTEGETRCAIGNLENGVAHTFTVAATNEAGEGEASIPSDPVTPRTVPDAPTGLSAVVAAGAVDLAWAAPAWNGGAAITRYTVTASPGGQTCTWSGGPLGCSMRSLMNGTQYTFAVRAENEAGEGASSAATPPLLLAGVPVGQVVVPDVAPPVSPTGAAQVGLICTRPTGGCTASAFLIVAGRQVSADRLAIPAGQTTVVDLPLPRDLQRQLARNGDLEVTVRYVIEEDGKRIERAFTYTLEAPPADRASSWRARPTTTGDSELTASCIGTLVERCEGEVILYGEAAQVRAARATKGLVVGRSTVAGPAGEPLRVRVAVNAAGRRLLARNGALRIAPEVSFGSVTRVSKVSPYVVTRVTEREWLRRAVAVLYTGGNPRLQLNLAIDAAKNGRMRPAAAARIIEREVLPKREAARERVDRLPVPPSRLAPVMQALEQSFIWSIRANKAYIDWLKTGNRASERRAWAASWRASAAKERLTVRLSDAGRRYGISVPPATRLWP